MDQLTYAAFVVIPEVNTPEITGGVAAAAPYSYAPRSVEAPCGRLLFSKSLGTKLKFTPPSVAGEPEFT